MLLVLCVLVVGVFGVNTNASSHTLMSEAFMSSARYERLSKDFLDYHKDPTNVFLHMLCSPLIYFGVLSLLTSFFGFRTSVCLCALHQMVLTLCGMPLCTWFGSTLVVAGVLFAVKTSPVHPWMGAVVLAVSLAAQGAGHHAAFQDAYAQKEDFWGTRLHHTLYLLPLVVQAAEKALSCAHWLLLLGCYAAALPRVFREWFPWQLRYNQLLHTELDDSHTEDIAAVRAWVIRKNPPNDAVSSWWRKSLDEEAGEAFDALASSRDISDMFYERFPADLFTLALLPALSQVSADPKQGFTDMRIDGPFAVFPFASVFRCMVALDENTEVITRFLLPRAVKAASTGDVIAWDYSREAHDNVVDETKPNEELRVVAYVYYVVYVSYFWPLGVLLGFLTTQWACISRILSPDRAHTLCDRMVSGCFNAGTSLFAKFEEHVGMCNLLYLAFLWHIRELHPSLLMAGMSYVHYFRYINTYHHASRQVSAGRFMRDAFLYKSLAMCWLGWYYFKPDQFHHFQPDIISIVVALAGLGISGSAMRALGMDATYFGVELGIAKPRWITAFPYGWIPHPMIVGQLIALGGAYLSPQFRTNHPYMAPAHMLMYCIHMAQEHYSLPARYGGDKEE